MAEKVHHPVVGDLTLAYEALNLLASWAATLDAAGSAAGQPGQAR